MIRKKKSERKKEGIWFLAFYKEGNACNRAIEHLF